MGGDNLDSRRRGNDESRRKNVPRENPPFSFIVGGRKLMVHFVVKYLFLLTASPRDECVFCSFTAEAEVYEVAARRFSD